ncbi:MAG: peptidylprolyl isomerase [Rhizobiaceae bacterium]|nr:peptidylprolyl isomerase [Rhizobiaceae bacterium]
MPFRFRSIAAAILFAALGWAAAPALAQDDTVIANVAGQPITEGDLKLAISELDQQFAQLPDEQKRAAALTALIEIRLLAAESEKAGVADRPDFKARMEFLRLRALHIAFVEEKVAGAITDEQVRARYDQEIASQPPVNEVRASHILVDSEEKAKEIIAKLDAGGDFAELAKENSSDGSAAGGGDLGFFGPGRMVPEFEQAAFALEVGQYTKEPVKSQFGWHIILVTDKRPETPPAFEQVAQQIRSILLREKYLAEVAAIREANPVEIVDPALKSALENPAPAPQP